jgi:hypothetical protein
MFNCFFLGTDSPPPPVPPPLPATSTGGKNKVELLVSELVKRSLERLEEMAAKAFIEITVLGSHEIACHNRFQIVKTITDNYAPTPSLG